MNETIGLLIQAGIMLGGLVGVYVMIRNQRRQDAAAKEVARKELEKKTEEKEARIWAEMALIRSERTQCEATMRQRMERNEQTFNAETRDLREAQHKLQAGISEKIEELKDIFNEFRTEVSTGLGSLYTAVTGNIKK